MHDPTPRPLNTPHTRQWWRVVLVVLGKELRDHLRDRRSLCLSMIYPLLGPVLLGGALYFAGNALQGEKAVEIIDIPTVGIGQAPVFEAFLKHHNIRLTEGPTNPRKAVLDGLVPVVLILPDRADPDGFEVRILQDLTKVANVKPTSRLIGLIHGFNRERAEKATSEAGLAPGFATHIRISRENVARDSNIALFFYNFIPPLLIFMIFLGAVYLSIDVTAGERERGSLEPLLIAPLERWELLLAKALASLLFTASVVAMHLAAFWLALSLAAGRSERLAAPPGPEVFFALFILAIPVMAVAVSFQMSIAMITRSMKEAQIYLGLLPLVPALPGMIMVIAPVTATMATTAIPIFGQMLIFAQLVNGEAPGAPAIIIATMTTTLLAAALFALAAKLFAREKMFFLS